VLGVTLYTGLKFVHVLAAIIAVGTNVTYGVWLTRARHSPESELFALRGVKFLDDRVANPAYGVLLIAGILTVLEGHWSFGQLWIVLGIVGYVLVVAIAVAVFTPSLRGQIEVLATDGRGSPRYRELGRRVQTSGAILGVIVIAIVFIMVTKPGA
jgi:uncharacterized membrane protein